MPRFAANLSFLFTEQPFLGRFAAARSSGFHAVEFHFPYAYTPAAINDELQEAQQELVLFNLPAGNWSAGERGIACHPQRVTEFQEGVGLAIEFARRLDCRRLNCLAGIAPPEVALDAARETLIENLRFAAALTREAGIELLLEPLNTRDTPGFLVPTPRVALALMQAVGGDAVRLQYDVYHAQVMEGDLACSLSQHLPVIGHIQIADNPGRHQPGTGEINFPFLFRHLDALGYAGWVGCEYVPQGHSADSFGWHHEVTGARAWS